MLASQLERGRRHLEGRRLADPALTFEVEANVAAEDASTIDKLKANIAKAVMGDNGSGGSLMAFVKKAAAAAGVLTPQLQAVPDTVAIVSVIKTETQSKTIIVQKRATSTKSPTSRPTFRTTSVPTKPPSRARCFEHTWGC